MLQDFKETKEFKIGDIIYNHERSNERRSDGQAPQLVRSSIRSIDVTCKKCARSWKAKEQNGSFESACGGGVITCTCGNNGCL